jgi:hypothetical protein
MENMENKEESTKAPCACEAKTDGKSCCGRFCGHGHSMVLRIFIKILVITIIFSVGVGVGVKMGRHAGLENNDGFRASNFSRHSNRGGRVQGNMMFRGQQTQQDQIIPQAGQTINQNGGMMRLQLPTGQINVQIPANQIRQ